MKKGKGIFFGIFIIVMGLFVFLGIEPVMVFAQEQGVERFGVELTTEDGEFSYQINWWQPMFSVENQYYLCLPFSAEQKPVILDIVSDDEVFLNGVPVKDGEKIPKLERYLTLSCGKKEVYVHVMYGSNLPIVYLTTKSGTMDRVYGDKDYKEPGYGVIMENNQISYEGELEYIKGRGNSSWDSVKKPLNIKFKKKMNLFDMGTAKKWCLLANYKDDTAMRNMFGSVLAERVGMSFTPESVFVDLYIDGDYIGHYQLSERIEVRKGRIDIYDLEKINESVNSVSSLDDVKLEGVRGEDSFLKRGSAKWAGLPKDSGVTNGGYLLELELPARYDSEISGFVSKYGQPVIVKSPEHATKAQVDYIRNYYQELEDALRSRDGKNQKGKHYSDYLDIESAAKMYVFQEYSKNSDGPFTSLFFYKDTGGKLIAGPVWDLDLAFGVEKEVNGMDFSDPEGVWLSGGHLKYELSDRETIFSLLDRHEDFRREVKRQWRKYFEPVIDELLLDLQEMSETNKMSVLIDKHKWSLQDRNFGETIETYDESIQRLSDFLMGRKTFMKKAMKE